MKAVCSDLCHTLKLDTSHSLPDRVTVRVTPVLALLRRWGGDRRGLFVLLCVYPALLSPFSTPLCLFSRKSQILLLLSYLFACPHTYSLYSIVFYTYSLYSIVLFLGRAWAWRRDGLRGEDGPQKTGKTGKHIFGLLDRSSVSIKKP